MSMAIKMGRECKGDQSGRLTMRWEYVCDDVTICDPGKSETQRSGTPCPKGFVFPIVLFHFDDPSDMTR
jgi:hypothetical protein